MSTGSGGSTTTTTNELHPLQVEVINQQLSGLGGLYYGTVGTGNAGQTGQYFGMAHPEFYTLSPMEQAVRNGWYTTMSQNPDLTGIAAPHMGAAMYGAFPVGGASGWAAAPVSQVYNPGVTGQWDPMTIAAGLLGVPGASGLANPIDAASGIGSIGIQVQGPQALGLNTDAALAAAQQQLEQLIAPELMNTLTASGMGRSGAQAEAIANAGVQLMQPILQADLAAQQQSLLQSQQANLQAQLSRQQAQEALYGQAYMGQLAPMMQSQLQRQQSMSDLYGDVFLNQMNPYMQGQLQYQQALLDMQNQWYNQQMEGFLTDAMLRRELLMQGGMSLAGLESQEYQQLLSNWATGFQLAGLDRQLAMEDFLRRQQLYTTMLYGMPVGFAPQTSVSQTSGGSTFDPWSMLTSAGSAALMGWMLCRAAEALYGHTLRTAAIRLWIAYGWKGKKANKFRRWYLRHGERLARQIRNGGSVAPWLTRLFEWAYHQGLRYGMQLNLL